MVIFWRYTFCYYWHGKIPSEIADFLLCSRASAHCAKSAWAIGALLEQWRPVAPETIPTPQLNHFQRSSCGCSSTKRLRLLLKSYVRVFFLKVWLFAMLNIQNARYLTRFISVLRFLQE